ncbi:hypothetical protein DIPPA_08731 [Diplonema papillatum]|nr:hypothetical protein DIPPA_16475 [Diplonema papillatum]KAJ9465459.1 hypothetical protein DIPPA_08731 [Diplonema papillatum]
MAEAQDASVDGTLDDPAALRAALEASQAELKEAKDRMSRWKDKMKGIVEGERAELRALRSLKEQQDAEIAELRSKAKASSLPNGTSGNASHSGADAGHEELIRTLREEKAELVKEKEAVQDDFERFKERTNVAMRLRGKEMATKVSMHSTLEHDLKQAQAELELVKNEKRKREAELARLEEEAAQASMSVARQFEVASHEQERYRKLYESENLAQMAAQREAMQELRDCFEQRQAEVARLHEQELAAERSRVDEIRAEAIAATQKRLDAFLDENVQLQTQVDDLRSSLQDAERKLAAVAQKKAVSADASHVRDLESRAKRLTEENEQLTKRVWNLQREVIETKDAMGALKEKPHAGEELSQVQQQSYLKSVIVSFLTAKGDEVKAGLIPILATLIQLTPPEIKSIYKQNPTWAYAISS